MDTARIYLDNAATSWPKPEAVYTAVDRYQRDCGAAVGRSAYHEAVEVSRLAEEARRSVARLIGTADARQIVFTANGTDSLNLALHGVLRQGDHVVTTVIEHNSVLRPLRALEDAGRVTITHVPCDAQGMVEPEAIRGALRRETRLIALSHASNVTGALQPAAEIGEVAHHHGAMFLLDAAQSLGHVPLDVGGIPVDLLAAPGHKGLLGPLGVGVLYIAAGVERHLAPQRQGGTGSRSDEDRQPSSLPDKYESGNHNAPGLIGLGAGVDYLLVRGLESIQRHERALTAALIDGLSTLPGVRVFGPLDPARRVGVVSIEVEGYDPQEVAAMLDAARRIQVRSGLHCAPLMHAALGTAQRGGTVRFSVGPFNTLDQIESTVSAVRELSAAGLPAA